MNCPQCDKPMELKAISEHWCFQCTAMFYGWQCSDCRIRTKTGCPHVEAEPPAKMLTTEQVRETLKAIFDGVSA